MSTSRTGAPPTKPVSDDEVRALLNRYRCPVPFHVVRTRLLGNIASPEMTASPMDTVAGLWGGELPAIDDLDALNELLRVLLMGLWNRLAGHQNRNAPFRMGAIPRIKPDRCTAARGGREQEVAKVPGEHLHCRLFSSLPEPLPVPTPRRRSYLRFGLDLPQAGRPTRGLSSVIGLQGSGPTDARWARTPSSGSLQTGCSRCRSAVVQKT